MILLYYDSTLNSFYFPRKKHVNILTLTFVKCFVMFPFFSITFFFFLGLEFFILLGVPEWEFWTSITSYVTVMEHIEHTNISPHLTIPLQNPYILNVLNRDHQQITLTMAFSLVHLMEGTPDKGQTRIRFKTTVLFTPHLTQMEKELKFTFPLECVFFICIR